MQSIVGGHLPNLQKIDVSSSYVGNRAAKAIGVAMQGGHLKHLVSLDLRGGESLGFCNGSVSDYGVKFIVEALEAGHCPNLVELEIESGCSTDRNSVSASLQSRIEAVLAANKKASSTVM